MTLWDTYRAVAEARADHPAVVDQAGGALTHGQLVDRAARAGQGLRAAGLGAGDHLGVFLPNRVSWLVAALGAARAGVGVLGLNTRFRQAELDHLLEVDDVEVVLVADRFLGLDATELMAGLGRPPRLLIDGAPTDRTGSAMAWAEITAGGPPLDREGAPTDPLIGFTTSGMTGFPKVAMHTAAQTLDHATAVIESFGLDHTTVTLVPLPLCGAFGYTTAIPTLLAGGRVVLHETWDPNRAAADIVRHRVTWFSASDDMLLAVAASPSFQPDTTWATGGFADFTNAGPEAVRQLDQRTGGRTRLAGLYGSSEGFALMASFDHRAGTTERSANGGHLVAPTMAVRACDPDTGRPLAHHHPGELQFRGSNLIARYLDNPEATARAFTDDGWYRSGDLGHTIEPDQRGHQAFVYLARLGDSLRLRGFLCDPAEIERHLETHDRVDLAQVVGVSKPGAGDRAVAFVRLTDEPGGADGAGGTAEIGERALSEHCRQGLANYKRPERIVVVEEFPVTDGPNGIKIRKVELRDRAAVLLDG